MNIITAFWNSFFVKMLGYTLLHSLWQAGLLLALSVTVLKFIPVRLSNIRYLVVVTGLFLMVVLSISTFFTLYSEPTLSTTQHNLTVQSYDQHAISSFDVSTLSLYATIIKSFIDENIHLFLVAWFLGALGFSIRVLTGLIYVAKLRNESVAIQNEWSLRLQQLAHQLHLKRWVALACSSSIQAPVVIGYIKPMILIPVGMLTNLSTEQLETIFLHELMHIRRKDYFINLVQSFVEAIFFFNPFVWILSGIIKREREHCCDDAVVEVHGNVFAYALALTSLEEVRLSKAGLSIPLAENKNQLLNRITRLMEKSVKHYSGRERIVPALLLFIGLICASWISTQSDKNEFALNQTPQKNILSDTTKKAKNHKKEKKIATNSVKEKANAEKKAAEKESSDEASTYGPAPLQNFDLDIPPPIPDVEAVIPPVPNFDDFEVPSMAWSNEQDLANFAKEFEEKFRAKFGDFYEKNGKDIQKMMEEIKSHVTSKMDEDFTVKMQDFALKQEEWARRHADEWQRAAETLSRQTERSLEDARRWEERNRIQRDEFEQNHKRFEENHKRLEENHKRVEERMKRFEEATKLFEEKLKEELIRDGYLDKDEKLNSLHWNNRSMEVNGKKIKSADEVKYNALHKKYFEEKLNALE